MRQQVVGGDVAFAAGAQACLPQASNLTLARVSQPHRQRQY
jgi:hypothetical protein